MYLRDGAFFFEFYPYIYRKYHDALTHHTQEKTMSAAAESTKTPFSLINNRRNKGKKTTDEEILIAFDEWLKKIATAFGNKKCCKDDCLSILHGNNICQGVTQYLLHWGQKDSPDRKQTIAEWYRYANPTGHTNAKLAFKLPYDASGMGELASHEFQGKSLCLSALRVLFDIGRKKWTAIKNVASTSGVSPIHKGKGKPSNRHLRNDNPVLIALRTTFKSWKILVSPLQQELSAR